MIKKRSGILLMMVLFLKMIIQRIYIILKNWFWTMLEIQKLFIFLIYKICIF